MPNRFLFAFLVAFSLLLLPSAIFAQVLTGSLEGTVKDDQGAVIAGANITAIQIETNLTRKLMSNESGFFRFEQLPPGRYRVLVAQPGFKQISAEAQVTLGAPVTLNLALPVGATTETVTVSAEAAAVELANAEVSRNVSDRSIQELPVLSRNPAELIQLYPGVPAITEDKNGSLTVGGLRPRSTIYNVDGSSNNFQVSSGPRTPIIPEAVQEVRALTNVYSAQYGKGAGAVIDMVLKSGTNQWRGSLFEYHRNAALNANDFFSNARGVGKGKFIHNIWGGTFGGPIRKDKTFFFAALEGTHIREGRIERVLVPSNAVRSPITDNPLSLATTASVANLINSVFALLPNCAATTPSCDFTSLQRNDVNQYVFSGKVDHTLTSRDTLTGRYLYRTYDSLATSAIAVNNRDNTQTDSNLAVTWRRVFNPKLVNELIFSFSNFRRDFQVGATLPDISIAGFSGIGAPSNLPQKFSDKYFGLADNISLIFGNHTVRTGGDFTWQPTEGFALFQGRGTYSFAALTANLGATDALTNFRLGRAFSFQQAQGDFLRRFTVWDVNAYVQDDWKVSSRLTLNLGMRYDLQLPPQIVGVNSGVEGFAAFDPTAKKFAAYQADKNNFSPSLGVAWDPFGSGKTSVRGGYRLAFDRIVQDYYNIGGLLQPPYINTVAVQLPQVTAIPLSQGQSVARATGLAISLMLTPDLQVNYAHSWHLTLQRQLTKGLSAEIGYLGTAGRALGIPVTFNRINPDTGRRPDPNFATITLVDDVGVSNYHGLTSMLMQRFSKQLAFTAAYTWSKAMDTTHDAVAPFGGESGNAVAIAQDANDRPRLDLEYGPAVFDRRHAFASSIIWQTPRLTSNPLAATLLNDWQVSGILFLQSGNPFPIFAGVDLNRDGINNDRPDLVQPGLLAPFNGVVDDLTKPLPRAAFSNIADPRRIGNFGRNVLRRDALQSFDLGLFKRFRLSERWRLEFRSEFFNFFNHPIFASPDNNLAASTFGQLRNQQNSPRRLRLGLKLTF